MKAVLRLYLRLYEGSIKAFLRLIKALYTGFTVFFCLCYCGVEVFHCDAALDRAHRVPAGAHIRIKVLLRLD
jgi:hypothetical protein